MGLASLGFKGFTYRGYAGAAHGAQKGYTRAGGVWHTAHSVGLGYCGGGSAYRLMHLLHGYCGLRMEE